MISWRKIRRMQSNQSKSGKKRNSIQANTFPDLSWHLLTRINWQKVFSMSECFRVAGRQLCFLLLLGGMVEAHLCARTLSSCMCPVNTSDVLSIRAWGTLSTLEIPEISKAVGIFIRISLYKTKNKHYIQWWCIFVMISDITDVQLIQSPTVVYFAACGGKTPVLMAFLRCYKPALVFRFCLQSLFVRYSKVAVCCFPWCLVGSQSDCLIALHGWNQATVTLPP